MAASLPRFIDEVYNCKRRLGVSIRARVGRAPARACRSVICEYQPRHRAKEFIGFLKSIDRSAARHLDPSLVPNNYAAPKTAEVKAWLTKHPRFKLHFTLTSASWLNLPNGSSLKSRRSASAEGTFASVAEREEAIHEYLDRRDAEPKSFVWSKPADAILEKRPASSPHPGMSRPEVRFFHFATVFWLTP